MKHAPVLLSAATLLAGAAADARHLSKEFYKDFGNARYTGKGVAPRMFHDLPECRASDEAEDHLRMDPR